MMTRGHGVLVGLAMLAACKGGDAPSTAGAGAGGSPGARSAPVMGSGVASGAGAPTTAARAATAGGVGSGGGSGASAGGGGGSGAGGGGGGGSGAGSGGGSGASAGGAVEPAAPLDAKIAAARCVEPCLFLVDTPVDKLAEAYKTACGHDTAPLPFDDCAQLDQLRKCVYAAHGFVFKQATWKAYERKPWYTAHPEFRPAQLTVLERANVAELDGRAKRCKKGLTVTAADLARVKAWLGAVDGKKAPLPRIVLVNHEPATRAELFAFLDEELQHKRLTLDAQTSVSYEAELPALLADAIGKPKDATLRSVLIDHGSTFMVDKDNAITEGVQLHLVYDQRDTLLAIQIAHYLYD